jgi:integrase/recombinase XerD
MTALQQAVEDYLRTRRALGFKLKNEGEHLHSFTSYMQAIGADTVTTAHAVRWATLPASAKPVYWAKRLGAVRGFARYLKSLDPATEIPSSELLPYRGWMRPTPHLYSQADIVALMTAAGCLKTRLGAATMQTLIGLLAVTGMRVGEAVRLDRDDIDLQHGRLVVRNSKFGKSRQLPLHPTTIGALRDYLILRDRLKPNPTTAALLIGTRGDRLSRGCAEWTFRLLRERVGLTARPGCRPPRLHDIRHSFAVQTMLDSYQTGGDPSACAAALFTYLGHADPGASYWYLSAAPELLALAATRLEHHLATEASS